MLGLLKRWLGWDTGSGPFDFGDLRRGPQDQSIAPQAPAPSSTTSRRVQKPTPGRTAPASATKSPPGPAKAQPSGAKQPAPAARQSASAKQPASAAKPAPGAKQTAKSPSSDRKPAPKRNPIDALHNPSLTLDKPSEDGFDPYNTGAFNRSASWERIGKHKR